MNCTTIAAISTPHAEGGIAVIRISGEKALKIADKIFRTASGKLPSEMKGYTCAYGHSVKGDEIIDEGVLTVFRGPKSYTGEDIAEISCHGGIYVSRGTLRAAIEAGAIPAEAGEFTKRAFLNGKKSLTEAEAVMDIISADSERELKFARSMQEGAVFRRIRSITDKIVTVLGALAAWSDYPEDDIPEVEPEALKASLEDIKQELLETIRTGDYGRIIKEGVSAVIIGRPNVGKSTLFNLLSGCERSIVTDIAGTTRDVVEERIRLGDVTLRLWDTAGLRETEDVIEKIGVNIAKERLERADLVLAVFDGTEPLSDEDRELLERLPGKRTIAVINKLDRISENDLRESLGCKFERCIGMSAKEGTGLEELHEAIEDMFYKGEVTPEMGILANERQLGCARAAEGLIEEAIEALEMGINLDAVTVLLDDAADNLMSLTGERASEKVVEEVFSRFCVGK
ncbi:MAG: tRNA uridine-5-carboxymethylaminomethyl(34) synthesis GTPase MnmE [Oscillospiraceae bacterium]|nr:tRNA uridine-5-carboxymethylaminomethyl(34) synthesis GTPase MnmE [Oscillospiraceae bacterium]